MSNQEHVSIASSFSPGTPQQNFLEKLGLELLNFFARVTIQAKEAAGQVELDIQLPSDNVNLFRTYNPSQVDFYLREDGALQWLASELSKSLNNQISKKASQQ